MIFYKSYTSEFSTNAPKCQEAFKSLFPKAIPSSVHIPMKQLTAMETVTRENTQVLLYVNLSLKALGKTTSTMELLLQQTDHNMPKECEQLLSHLQMQTSCLNSLDKALETVTDLFIAHLKLTVSLLSQEGFYS